MTSAKLWRRFPVRGPGRLVLAGLRHRARSGPVTAEGPGGIRVRVDPANPPEASVYVWGTYEPEVVAALERLLDADDVVVDVGANCGVLTAYMASRLPHGHVLALDPSARACARVEQQAALNGFDNVEVRRCAVGRYPASALFSPGRVGIGALPAEDTDLTAGPPSRVDVRPLDELVDRCELVKIDTDGGEVDVLEGASALLAAHAPALVFEVTERGLRRRGKEVSALLGLLARHDYTVYEPLRPRRARWRVGPYGVHGFRELGGAKPVDGNYVALSPRSGSHSRRLGRLLAR